MISKVLTHPSSSKTQTPQQQIQGGYRFAELCNSYLSEPEPKFHNLRWFIVSQQSHPKLGFVWLQGKIPQLWHLSDFVVLTQLIFKRQNRCYFEKIYVKKLKENKMIADWTRTKLTLDCKYATANIAFIRRNTEIRMIFYTSKYIFFFLVRKALRNQTGKFNFKWLLFLRFWKRE